MRFSQSCVGAARSWHCGRGHIFRGWVQLRSRYGEPSGSARCYTSLGQTRGLRPVRGGDTSQSRHRQSGRRHRDFGYSLPVRMPRRSGRRVVGDGFILSRPQTLRRLRRAYTALDVGRLEVTRVLPTLTTGYVQSEIRYGGRQPKECRLESPRR